MVSGYVGRDSIRQLHKEANRNRSVAVELVVGMAAKEGLTQQTYDALLDLHKELVSRVRPEGTRQGVYVYFSGPEGQRFRGMHAKAYLFDSVKSQELIVGSSNFSSSGLEIDGNVEMNIVDSNQLNIERFIRFFDELHESNLAVPIDLVDDFPIRGKAIRNRRRNAAVLTRVKEPAGFKRFRYVDIDLARNVDSQMKSNLNVCFGRGRWARATGKIAPRDWYEVELISPKSVCSNVNYPRGEFEVVTSDGFAFRATTNGDYYKNLRSAEDLKILGLWLKGLLEDAGVLSDDPQQLVTSKTFEDYGNSVLRIYRPNAKEAIFHFPSDPKDL